MDVKRIKKQLLSKKFKKEFAMLHPSKAETECFKEYVAFLNSPY
jgi:hypothetical protein